MTVIRPASSDSKPPLPPVTRDTAMQKVRMAEDAWNSRDPARVVQVYTRDTQWPNRAEFPVGRDQVRAFLERKLQKEKRRRALGLLNCGA